MGAFKGIDNGFAVTARKQDSCVLLLVEVSLVREDNMIYWIIGMAGMIGALLRYVAEWLFPAGLYWGFPFGTLLVNFLGCFLLSWFTVWSVQVFPLPSWFRTGFGTGLIGSFTTFSAFSAEVVNMIHIGLWQMALVYIFLSLWGGLFLAWYGSLLAVKQKKEPEGVNRI